MRILFDFNKYEASNVGYYIVDITGNRRHSSCVSKICLSHALNFQDYKTKAATEEFFNLVFVLFYCHLSHLSFTVYPLYYFLLSF